MRNTRDSPVRFYVLYLTLIVFVTWYSLLVMRINANAI